MDRLVSICLAYRHERTFKQAVELETKRVRSELEQQNKRIRSDLEKQHQADLNKLEIQYTQDLLAIKRRYYNHGTGTQTLEMPRVKPKNGTF